MVLNLGDVPAGSTLYVPFATYNSTGASVTITGLATTDIEIYKNGSTTQRSSDNGYALLDTDGIDFDGITGIHGFSVDLSDNTDAGFYAAGSVYWLVVSAITVDSQTVNFVYYFTIDKMNVLRPTTAGRTLDVTAGGEAGIDWANIGSPTTTVNLSGTTVKTATDVETDTADIQTRLPAALVSGRIDASVGAMASGVLTATAIAADAITDAKVASDVTIASVTGAVGSVTGNVGGNVAGSVGSVTATVNANMTQISGDSGAADNLETLLDDTAGAVPWAGIIDQGTAQSATSTTLVLRSAAAFANDEIIGATIVITGGSTGVGQSRTITDYVSASDTATVEAWTTTPSGTITYKIFATAPNSGGGGGLDAAGVRAAIGMSSANLDTQLSGLDGKLDTIDNFIDTEVAAIKAKTDQLTFTTSNQVDATTVTISANAITATAIASNAITAAKIATDAIDADAIAADAVTEIQSGLATAANLATVAGYIDTEVASILAAVDTEVAAIKAKTDQLTFTTTNMVDVAVKRVGDTTLTAAGTGGQGYGAA